jgi:hypothetical protein
LDIGNHNDRNLRPPFSALIASQSVDFLIGPIFAVPQVLAEHGIDPKIAFVIAGVDLRFFRIPTAVFNMERGRDRLIYAQL